MPSICLCSVPRCYSPSSLPPPLGCTLASLPRDLAFRVHQLLLLRAKLVLFTNNLNNYLMTRVGTSSSYKHRNNKIVTSLSQILHSVGLEFQANVAQVRSTLFTLFPQSQFPPLPQAEDLDSIITLHREYVSTIFDRCLLNKKVSSVVLGGFGFLFLS